MNIRAAFDISVLGSQFGRSDPKTGIVRVAEELLFELAARKDIDLTAVALTGDDPLLDSVHSDAYARSVATSVHVGFARSFSSRLRLGSLYKKTFTATELQEKSPGANGSAHSLFWRALRSVLYRLNYTYKIDRCFHTFDSKAYDVFHSPNLKMPPESLTRGLPRVLTVYDLIPVVAPQFVTSYQTNGLKQLLGRLNIDRDWVACISEHVKNEFCEYSGMSSERVFVTPLAAADHFRPISDRESITSVRQRYNVPEGRYFLSLAAPQPRKNLVHLIRCFFRLLEETPGLDVNLVLAGSTGQGWLYDDIFATAASSPHRARVVFTGFVADEDLAALYTGATAFVFPSLYEGFGLPPLEAMACGTPVISSDATSLPEVVGEAGLLVKPTDESALCDAMLAVLNNSELRDQLSQKGLARAAQFSWQRCAAETVNVYRAAVSE